MVAKQWVVCLREIILSLLWKGLGRILLTHISSKHSSLVSLSFVKCRFLGEQRWGGILSCMRGLIASFNTKLNCSGLVICPSCENSSTTTFCLVSSRALWLASWTSLVNTSCPVGRVFGNSLGLIVSSVSSTGFLQRVCTIYLG